LVAGAVGIEKSRGQPEAVLTETILAKRDHLKVLRAISEMCADNSVATTSEVTVVNAPAGSEEEVHYPALSQKPTTFQISARNYSEELRDQRIRLDQEINGGQALSWWFKVAIAALGTLAAILIGLKPLFERFERPQAGQYWHCRSRHHLSGTVGTLSSFSALADARRTCCKISELAQLQQLHWRVGNDVFAATSLCATSENGSRKDW
jgi:hypothetical protein